MCGTHVFKKIMTNLKKIMANKNLYSWKGTCGTNIFNTTIIFIDMELSQNVENKNFTFIKKTK